MTVLEMIKKIEGFRESSYGSVPLREETIQMALHLTGHLPPGEWSVSPQHDGEIWFEKEELTEDGQRWGIIVLSDIIPEDSFIGENDEN